jgi:hypothetical protein
MTPGAVGVVWGASLALGAVVIVVVALLLQAILGVARRIEGGLGDIWIAGQAVANNTIHIALLRRTNLAVGRLCDVAGGVLRAVAAIHRHAQQCPRCPACARRP